MNWRDVRMFIGSVIFISVFTILVPMLFFEAVLSFKMVISAIFLGIAISLVLLLHRVEKRRLSLKLTILVPFCVLAVILGFMGLVWFSVSVISFVVLVLYLGRNFKLDQLTIIGDEVFLPGEVVNIFYRIGELTHHGSSIRLGTIERGNARITPHVVDINLGKLCEINPRPKIDIAKVIAGARDEIDKMIEVEIDLSDGKKKIIFSGPGRVCFCVCNVPIVWSGRAHYTITA